MAPKKTFTLRDYGNEGIHRFHRKQFGGLASSFSLAEKRARFCERAMTSAVKPVS
jgi:hypothetical protein